MMVELVVLIMVRYDKSNIINVLSFGAGVQSSTIALMIKHGEIPGVVAGIFADTQSEPQYVYNWLDYITPLLPFPIIKDTNGNLAQDVMDCVTGKADRMSSPPFYTYVAKNLSCSYSQQLHRSCTQHYKLRVIRRNAKLLKHKYNAYRVNQFIGISTDEAHRMKTSDVWYVVNSYPLIDLNMSRDDCVKWLESHNYPVPKKSACWMCPYASMDKWKEIHKLDPQNFAKAVELDAALRPQKIPNTGNDKDYFIWYRLKPLSEFNILNGNGQIVNQDNVDGFGNECEGLCGV